LKKDRTKTWQNDVKGVKPFWSAKLTRQKLLKEYKQTSDFFP
jgi:hypothetical protein